MANSAFTAAAAWAVAALFVFIALAVYGRQVGRILREGGKVRVCDLGLPGLLMSLVFAGYFTMVTVLTIAAALRAGHQAREPEVNINLVLLNSLVFILFTAGIAGFLHYRGLRLREIFGLDRMRILAALGWSCGLVVAAFPILETANALTVLALHGNAESQVLVDLFSTAAHHHDYRAMGAILFSAVFIQPACEEFLFRGLFYGAWKRYLGSLRGGFLASLLFAAFHTSLAAFAGLFVLAVCLNIAYERTGSLLVPILMHALFNFAELLLLFGFVQFGTPQ